MLTPTQNAETPSDPGAPGNRPDPRWFRRRWEIFTPAGTRRVEHRRHSELVGSWPRIARAIERYQQQAPGSSEERQRAFDEATTRMVRDEIRTDRAALVLLTAVGLVAAAMTFSIPMAIASAHAVSTIRAYALVGLALGALTSWVMHRRRPVLALFICLLADATAAAWAWRSGLRPNFVLVTGGGTGWPSTVLGCLMGCAVTTLAFALALSAGLAVRVLRRPRAHPTRRTAALRTLHPVIIGLLDEQGTAHRPSDRDGLLRDLRAAENSVHQLLSRRGLTREDRRRLRFAIKTFKRHRTTAAVARLETDLELLNLCLVYLIALIFEYYGDLPQPPANLSWRHRVATAVRRWAPAAAAELAALWAAQSSTITASIPGWVFIGLCVVSGLVATAAAIDPRRTRETVARLAAQVQTNRHGPHSSAPEPDPRDRKRATDDGDQPATSTEPASDTDEGEHS